MEYDRHFSYYPQTSSPRNPQSQEQRKRNQHHLICFSSCFRSPTLDAEAETSLVRSSSSWIRSKAQEFPDEVRGKYRNFLSRHKRRHSSDFGYDPSSYARNFDDGGETNGESEEEFPYKCFSARLPQSPQSRPSPMLPVPEVRTMPSERIGKAVPLLEKPKTKGKSPLIGLNSV
ncbi:hypothetical protein FCM35_KLT02114 [Carex littledalei]|uniref:Uncharacterized protein n=1 Tax=Carex littledalei TaxID=544730 RepID=A0A833R3J0_9POAL|nr:hypothetical protein FCM35_KLT02114 [Carex littledalei]